MKIYTDDYSVKVINLLTVGAFWYRFLCRTAIVGMTTCIHEKSDSQDGPYDSTCKWDVTAYTQAIISAIS